VEKGKYTKPDLRERIKAQVMSGSDGGRPGQWSARKAQLVAQKYKAAGGGYKGGPDSRQQGLKKWTREDWTTADGEKAERKDSKGRPVTKRYLPRSAWEGMSEAEKRATDAKKTEASRRGVQFVSNTRKAQAAGRRARGGNESRHDGGLVHHGSHACKGTNPVSGLRHSKD